MRKKIRTASWGNSFTAALLLDAYLAVEQGRGSRKVVLDRLEKALNRYLQKTTCNPVAHFSRMDIDNQFGKLEYAMTDGQRGLLGVPPPWITDIVTMYREKREIYQRYLQFAAIGAEWMICGGNSPSESKPVQLEDNNGVEEISDTRDQSKGKNALRTPEDTVPESPKESLLSLSETASNTLQTSAESDMAENGEVSQPGEIKYAFITEDSPIEELELPTRIYRCLKRSQKIETVKALLDYPDEQLLQLPGMGKKSLAILLEEKEKIREVLLPVAATSAGYCSLDKTEPTKQSAYSNRLPKILPVDWQKWIWQIGAALYCQPRLIRKYLRERNFELTQGTDQALALLWDWDVVRDIFKKRIVYFLDKTRGKGVSLEDLQKALPEAFCNTEKMKMLLTEMEATQKVKIYGDMVYAIYPTLEEYVKNIPDENKRRIISLRLNGETLGAIAKEVGLTRERIRQIQKKFLNPKIRLMENQYQYFWEAHPALSVSDMQYVLNLPDRTVQYLRLVTEHTDSQNDAARMAELQKLKDDDRLNEITRSRVKNLMEQIDGCFVLAGQRVGKTRPALLKYVVQIYAKDKIRCADLKKKYDQLLETLGLAGNQSFSTDLRYFDHLAAEDFTLWNRGRSLRYYEIANRSYERLLHTLGLEKLQDVEYSTLKFFRDYPDLMRDYDIRDEYELHNLLRKIWDRDERNAGLDVHHRVEFAKMPTIRIGVVNRHDQIYRFILEHEPIKKAELIPLYEKTYGVRVQTFQGNAPLQDFDQYCFNGEYRIHRKALPKAIVFEMREELDEDFYTLTEIKELYLDIAPDGELWDIDEYALHQLGFASHGNYVIRDTYSTASDFFKSVLTADDVVDLRDRRYYRNYSPFGTAVSALAASGQVLEVMPDIFWGRRKLEAAGVTTEGIQTFCQHVHNFVPADKLFTIYSLKQHGFTLPWEEAGFQEYFYNSLLAADKTDFQSLLCGGGRLFYHGTLGRPLAVGDLYAHIARSAQRKISIPEMRTMIAQRFGLQAAPEKIREFVRQNPAYKGRILF